MVVTHPSVELLASTPNPLALVFAAFRQCYHAGMVTDIWAKIQDGTISPEQQVKFVTAVLASGHTSPVEHISFTFALGGISRACTHQLVRHRLASWSQQSQRYVDESDFAYLIPPEIAGNSAAQEKFCTLMAQIASVYAELRQIVPAEDARFVLPNATASNLVMTMNARELLHFFEERCCMRAQWEIRNIAELMLAKCKAIIPAIFASAGAKCVRFGYCPEGEKFCCGRYPVQDRR